VDEISQLDRLQIYVFASASSILEEISLAPRNRFYEILKNRFKEGILNKIFLGNPYETLYRAFISQELFESSDRMSKTVTESHRSLKIVENTKLPWFGGLLPGYSKELAEEHLQNRYTKLAIPIQLTLKHLSSNSEFKRIVEKLRAEGWLDWHIMSSVFSITVNYRVMVGQAMMKNLSYQNTEGINKLYQEALREVEGESSVPVPFSEFTEEKLREHQRLSMISTIKVLGLECRQQTPDLDAIDHFLRHRYNYWTDDIEHTDPFL
jgi:hypothetical protein